jgi:anthranilate/para-aminobenzoate synthase component II
MSIYLYDFNDSFTYNIYSEVFHLNQNIQVIALKDAQKSLESLINKNEKSLVILGPGPGSPSDYEFLDHTLSKILKSKNIFVMGVCLGHQLIAKNMGMTVQKSQRPIHGESLYFKIDKKVATQLQLPDSFYAQRYNSLGIRADKNNQDHLEASAYQGIIVDQEYIIFYGERLLSYQFHPESIGTNYRQLFFNKPLSFLL